MATTTLPTTNGTAATARPAPPPRDVGTVLRDELERIERQLACRSSRWASAARRKGGVWSPDVRDPEFRKVLRNLARLVADAEGIHRRVPLGPGELAELAEAASLPRRAPWTIEVLLARRFRLEALLIDLGDEKYLRERAAAFYMERCPTGPSWRTMYPHRPPPLLAGVDGGRAADRQDVAATRRMLQQLVAAKHFDDVPMRNKNELTLRVLRIIAPVVLLASVAFALAIALTEGDDGVLRLAAAAGATGAALGTLIRVRDDLVPGSQIREFGPFFLAQVTVGATAGMLAFLVDRSGVATVGGEAGGLAALSFALGFTEAAFLRLISRVATLAGGPAAPPAPPAQPPSRDGRTAGS